MQKIDIDIQDIKIIFHPICPFSRQVRVLIEESELECSIELKREDYWLKNNSFININPLGELPVLIINKTKIITSVYSAIEFLIDCGTLTHLFPNNIFERAKIRSTIRWFNQKFNSEVLKYIIDEKVIKLLARIGSPNTNTLRDVRQNIKFHLQFINKLLEKNSNLVLDKLTIADLVAASHVSILDYLGEIDWQSNPKIKDWYLIIKSRPSFRQILKDYIIGIVPSKNYYDLDF